MAMPLVSVVLIFFNAEAFICEAVESVLAQTVSDLELILVDDGSSDGSTAIARDYAEYHSRIHYIDHPGHENCGMSASRNLGARSGTAPFLAFIDADDVWQPDKLAEQLAILEANPEAALVCGALLYWSSWQGAEAANSDRLVLTGNMADRLLHPPEAAMTLYPLGSTPGAGVDFLVRRTAFEAVGGFENCFRGLYEDQAFLLKIYLRHPVFISGRPWIMYRQHGTSSVAISARHYLRIRMTFLNWFGDYISDGNFDEAIRGALRNARRSVYREQAKALLKPLGLIKRYAKRWFKVFST